MQVEGWSGIWALGDRACVPDRTTSLPVRPPPTRHPPGSRARPQHRRANGRQPLKRFRFKTLGLLAVIGRRTEGDGILASASPAFFARFLWRTIYPARHPRLEKKVRVAPDWSIDLFLFKGSRPVPYPQIPLHARTSVHAGSRWGVQMTHSADHRRPAVSPRHTARPTRPQTGFQPLCLTERNQQFVIS